MIFLFIFQVFFVDKREMQLIENIIILFITALVLLGPVIVGQDGGAATPDEFEPFIDESIYYHKDE